MRTGGTGRRRGLGVVVRAAAAAAAAAALVSAPAVAAAAAPAGGQGGGGTGATLSVLRQPLVAFVGDAAHAADLGRAMAVAGTAAPHLAMVDAGPSLDALTPPLLRAAATVVLYGPVAATASPGARRRLAAFVRAGGGLFVDSGDSSSPVAPLRRGPGSLLPVVGLQRMTVGGAWGLSSPERAWLALADAAAWAPPNFAGTRAWAVTTATTLAPGAVVVLRCRGWPVLVERREGAGRVLWSGINLPFHVAAFASRAESAFLDDLLATAPARLPGTPGRVVVAHRPTRSPGAAYRVEARLAGAPRALVLRGVHGTVDLPGASWVASVGGRQVPCLVLDTAACLIALPAGATGAVVVAFRNGTEAGGALLATVLLALLAVVGIPVVLGRARVQDRVVAAMVALLHRGPWRARELGLALHAPIAGMLHSGDPEVRRAALTLIGRQPLRDWAPALVRMASGDPAPEVLDDLALMMRNRMWEPVDTPATAELRRWADRWLEADERGTPVGAPAAVPAGAVR